VTALWVERLRSGLQARLHTSGVRAARIEQVLPLGPGSRLLVVGFGGRRLLIGQGRGGLVRLAEDDAGERP
jgi:hypothetical protein